MLRPDGRAAEQSRDRASKAKTGEGGLVSTLDHDSCNPVQIALTEDAIPRAVGSLSVCVRARANGVSSGC